MTLRRLFADVAGESHVETIGATRDRAAQLPDAYPASAVTFMVLSQGEVPGAWHPAPQRAFVCWLRGTSEVETSDGARSVLGPGDALLCEDVSGRGYRNHHHGEVHVAYVHLDP